MKTNRMTSQMTRGGAHVPNNLPPRLHPFINRKKEIQQATTILLQDKTPAVVLTGMGGIGKTSLAIEIAYRLFDKGEFAGGMVWLPARDLQSFDDLIGAVGNVLGIPAPEVGAHLSSQPCLVILDGFDELHASRAAEIERFFQIFPAKSKLLITSRSQPDISLPATVIHIGLFDEQAAKEFLAALGVPPDKEVPSADQEIIDEIIRNTGYHPLALELTSSLIRGTFVEALKDFQRTIDVSDSVKDERRGAALRYTLASMLQARGDYEQALKYLEASLRITRAAGDKTGESATLNNISQIYAARGDYERALGYLEASLKISQEIGDKAGEGRTLNNISQIYAARGDYERALGYLEASLKIILEIGDRAGEGRTLNNISQIYAARGDYERALGYLEASLKISQEIGDKAGERRTLNNISQIYAARGDYERALGYLEASLKIILEIGDRAGEGRTLNNISQIYDARGDYERALGYLEASLRISRELGDKKTESRILNNISLVLFNSGLQNVEQGRWYEALRQFKESLAIRRQNDDFNARADTIYQIARVHHLIGNLDKARIHYRDALRLYEHTGNDQAIAICKTGLGRLMLQMGFLDDALHELDSARQIYRQQNDDRHIAEIDELLRVANQAKEGQPA